MVSPPCSVASCVSAMDAAALKSPCVAAALGEHLGGSARRLHTEGEVQGAILFTRGAVGKPEMIGKHMARRIAPQLPCRCAISTARLRTF